MFHVEFYLCFRYPNLKSVRELVYKRGYGKVGNQRIPLTDNALIEKHLGRFLVILGESILLLLKLLSLINLLLVFRFFIQQPYFFYGKKRNTCMIILI